MKQVGFVDYFLRDGSIHIERANMHRQGIACTKSFDMGLKTAEIQKLGCFNEPQIIFLLIL
jgi:hypothetical protein